MIYTSYFAKLKQIDKDITPIAICAEIPPWFQGFSYRRLAPTWTMLSEYKRTNNQYMYEFLYRRNILGMLNAKQVEEDLMRMSGGKDVVLLCYENPQAFCHRHLVRDWFREHDILCEEYTKGENV